MPPKVSKKTEQKKKEKIIEDKTFGLKNKNKSKAVQRYIQSVAANVQNAGTKQAKAEEKRRQERLAAKQAKKKQDEELAALFGAALAVNMKKKATKYANQPDAEAKDTGGDAKGEEKKMTAQEALEAQQKEKAEARAHSGPVFEQATFFVAEEERTIENIIEERRAELAARGIVGTPVTEESFAKWKEDRRLRRLEENAKKVQEEQKKKEGGKGLSVLSGKALFEYDPTLFVDDDEAMDRSDEVQFPRNLDPQIEDAEENGDSETKNGDGVQVQEGLFAEDGADDADLDDLPDDDDDEEEDDENNDDDEEENEDGDDNASVDRTSS